MGQRWYTCRASWYTALSSESKGLFSGCRRPCGSEPLTSVLLELLTPNDEGSTLCELGGAPYTITSSAKNSVLSQEKHNLTTGNQHQQTKHHLHD